jgi:hypothetical protein
VENDGDAQRRFPSQQQCQNISACFVSSQRSRRGNNAFEVCQFPRFQIAGISGSTPTRHASNLEQIKTSEPFGRA